MVVENNPSPNSSREYVLLCLDDAKMMYTTYWSIEDMIRDQFGSGKYHVIKKEDLVLSNGN